MLLQVSVEGFEAGGAHTVSVNHDLAYATDGLVSFSFCHTQVAVAWTGKRLKIHVPHVCRGCTLGGSS